ncbi:transcriptional regulator [Rhodanobacter thiooxydans]|uniref:Transcriptional regulator n=1 Tax=Rhodanobacter thiooxydans TaxID=416169 RepID=A0A154QJJ9_9GAMM|nr:helix-turn-helix transcriptional regulator [Rhodanobacter thiooxydans]KZC24015.1 transcriptional regulator [Rhodanobacter thiooxydans]
MPPSRLGQKIRTRRKHPDLDLTLDELAKAAGMSKSYLWELENRDTVRPSAEKLLTLASALGVTVEYLLEEEATQAEHVDKGFFRDYLQLEAADKEQLRRILRTFKKPG